MIRDIETIAYEYATSIQEETGGDPECQMEVIQIKLLLMDFLAEVEQNWPSESSSD